MNRIFKGFSCLTSLGILAAACQATPADSGASESDIRVRPGDTENQARLTLSLPTGSCLPGGSCSRPLSGTFAATIDDVTVNLGVATRLKPGEHTIGVNGAVTKLTLGAGQVRNYTFAVARSKCTAAPLTTVPATDFGKSVALSNVACPTSARGSSSPSVVSTYANTYFSLSPDGGTIYCPASFYSFTSGADCSGWSRYTIVSVAASTGAKPQAFCGNVTSINAETACRRAQAGDWAWTKGGYGGGASLVATDRKPSRLLRAASRRFR
jgi:hypothetical protein